MVASDDHLKQPSGLERLEEVVVPEIVRRVWQIVIVDSDGSRREAEKIESQPPGPVLAFRKRYR